LFSDLDSLVKENKKWLRIAFSFCRCQDRARDIVQDMYLQVGIKGLSKKVNYCYIYAILKTIFLHQQRNKSFVKNKERIKVEFVEFNELYL
jgi:hypothetical protein